MPSGCQPFGRSIRVGRPAPESCAATAGATASDMPIAKATSTARRRTVDVMTVLGAAFVRGWATVPLPVLQTRNRHPKARDDPGGSGRRGLGREGAPPQSAPAGSGGRGLTDQATVA